MLELVLCVLIADLITGFAHWLEDTYGVRTWPGLIGRDVIDANIRHHLDPIHMTMGSFLFRNYQQFLLAAAIVSLVWSCDILSWQLATVTVVASLGNEVHAWSHSRPKSRFLRLLQDMAIVQTPQQHAKHHKPPFDRYFCTLTNVMNPLLEGIGFWRKLEWVVRVLGVYPKRMTAERDFV